MTLLLGDVEGSVRMWESNPSVAKDVMRRFQEVVTEVVARHGGVRPEEQGEGDSFVAAFPRATDGVRAALDLQLALSPDRWPGAPRLRLAAHTGEVELRDERNYIGETVHRTARLRNTGYGGQTLISAATMELVRDRLPDDASMLDLGMHRLRDLGRPEHVWQLCHPRLDSSFPALKSLDALPHNLPSLLTPFVGRERELSEVSTLLGAARLLTLVGPGGAGKTRLALQAAADDLENLPGGAWFVDLAPIGGGEQVLTQVAAAMRVSATDDDSLATAIAGRAGTERTLLILDNCEHVVADAAATSSALLGTAPGLRIVATSREPLGVPGEVTWRVPSMSLPPADGPVEIGTVSASEAVQLFTAAARRAQPAFRLDESSAPAVAAICTRLDGIPLALELAAALLRFLTVADVVAGLDDRFRLLGAGPRTVLPRQQTLRASIDWSYQLLDRAERVLLNRLSVFAGAVPLTAVEGVTGFTPLERQEVFVVLTRLVDKSLVVVDDASGSARFRLLDTVRHYASEQLTIDGDPEEMRVRHLEHCRAVAAATAEASDKGGAEIDRAVTAADELRLEFEAALTWLETVGRVDDALQLFADLGMFWAWYPVAGRRWLLRLTVGESSAASPQARLRALLVAGWISDHAVHFWEVAASSALGLAEELGDKGSALKAKMQLGAALTGAGEVDRGLALLHDVIDAGAEQDRVAVAEAQMWVASQAYQLGQVADCARIMTDLLPLLREVLPPAVPVGLSMLGISENMLGRPHRMRDLLAEALELAEATNDVPSRAAVLGRVAALELSVGNIEAARLAAEEVVTLADRADFAHVGLQHLALCALAEDDVDAAARHVAEATSRTMAAGDMNLLPQARLPEVEVMIRRGCVAEARVLADDLLAKSRGVRNRVAERFLLMLRARIALEEGEPAVAEDYAQAAAQVYEETGIVLGLPDLLEELAALSWQAGDIKRAGRLYGAARSIREDAGFVRIPYVRNHAAEAAEFGSISSEEAQEATAEGALMSPTEALAYARRGRGERKRPLAGWSALTPTEVEVVRLVAQHLTNPQIAERLFMSRNTVRTHLTHIFDKVGVRSRSALASEATKRGLV